MFVVFFYYICIYLFQGSAAQTRLSGTGTVMGSSTSTLFTSSSPQVSFVFVFHICICISYLYLCLYISIFMSVYLCLYTVIGSSTSTPLHFLLPSGRLFILKGYNRKKFKIRTSCLLFTVFLSSYPN